MTAPAFLLRARTPVAGLVRTATGRAPLPSLGRLRAAVAVGRRSGDRSGGPRPDPQGTAGVRPGDRPAPGADGVDVDGGQGDRAAADGPVSATSPR